MPKHRLAPTEKGCPRDLFAAAVHFRYGNLDPEAVTLAFGKATSAVLARVASPKFLRDWADAIEARDRVHKDGFKPADAVRFVVVSAYIELVCARGFSLGKRLPPPSSTCTQWDRDKVPKDLQPTFGELLAEIRKQSAMVVFFDNRDQADADRHIRRIADNLELGFATRASRLV